MAGRKSKLTPEVQETIVAYIRGGVFPWVAAQAAGVGRSTFYRWKQLGERARSGRYREFFEAAEEASAKARAGAEVRVHQENPLAWLRYGPGRQRQDEPGWTETHEVTQQGPLRVTFDIERASGGIVLPRNRHDDDVDADGKEEVGS